MLLLLLTVCYTAVFTGPQDAGLASYLCIPNVTVALKTESERNKLLEKAGVSSSMSGDWADLLSQLNSVQVCAAELGFQSPQPLLSESHV